ncbi:MBL fold metallo-hydrolase [Metabacillus niabensis]|uniref:MBL fold metallo-hydrolase n=1 Tax=Metabacillus niabensis TaxID=324854 RepID=UPI0039A1A486
MQKIGPLLIVEGANNSKVPFSRSLYIESEKLLIDTGAEAESLVKLEKEKGINIIYNTHYHPDHTRHNYLFPSTKKIINRVEFDTCHSLEKVANQNGITQEWGLEGMKEWAESIPESWIQGISGFNGSYEYEREMDYDHIKLIFLHTPGHTKGYSCPYFPDLGVVYTGDYDMTSFGPWYNGADGSIDQFIQSGERLLSLDAKTYITGHQKGIFTKEKFKEEMVQFLAIIEKRDEIITQYVQKGLTFEEIASIGIFYPKKALDNKILYTWERIGIRKHLKRLGYSTEGASHNLVQKQ